MTARIICFIPATQQMRLLGFVKSAEVNNIMFNSPLQSLSFLYCMNKLMTESIFEQKYTLSANYRYKIQLELFEHFIPIG